MTEAPEFRIDEDGQLVEVVRSTQSVNVDEENQRLAEAQAALNAAETDYNNKSEVSKNADAAADTAARELETAQKVKEDAEAALLKSQARLDAIASAKPLVSEQPESEEAEGSGEDAGEPDETDDSAAIDIPVSVPGADQPA